MRLAWVLVGVVAAGCKFDPNGLGGAEGPGLGDTTTASTGVVSTTSGTTLGGVDTTVGMSSSGDDTAITTTTAASTGEGGSTGPAPPALVDTGLLARWYIDEASDGQGPLLVIDHQPPGVDVIPAYSAFMDYGTVDDNRGLEWSAPGMGGRPLVAIAGTKLETELDDATQVTFELVLAVDEVTGDLSRFLHIGTSAEGGDFAIGATTLDSLELRWRGETLRTFEASFTGDRQVLQVVVDTDQAKPVDRFVAYLDGVALHPLDEGAPDQGQGLQLEATSSLVLGNRTDGQRSFRGALLYAAIYTAALAPTDLEYNRGILSTSDDAP
jgi:hypothetical protein